MLFMIIVRYLSRQILQVTAAITFLLLAVVVLGRFLKYLGQASQGEIDSSVLALLMIYRLPEFVQIILPLAILLGILLAYGRMYAENEMTVLIACGLSRVQLLTISLVSSGLVTLIVAVLTLSVTPWGLVNTATLLESQKDLNEFDVMVPGIFQDISRGARTTYSQSIEDNQMQNVFMYERDTNRITVAENARLDDSELEGRLVVFSDGSLSQGIAGEQEYSLTTFSELGIRIPQRDINFEISLEEQAMSTSDLLSSKDASHMAELQWRISLIVAIPILTLLAVPLSRVSPRQGRFARLAPAILIYIFYLAMMMATRDLIADGELTPTIGIWGVHLLFLVLGALLFFEKIPQPSELKIWKKNA